MKTLFTSFVVGISVSFAAEISEADMAARKASVVTLETHLAQREKRLNEVVAEIRERGQATNAKIEELVKMLSDLKDSQDSKRRVSQVKGETIAGLKRMIGVYQSERAKISGKLRDDPASAEALRADTKVIDDLIDKRAADIVELVKSMPGGEDVSKYEQDSETYYDGVYYENSRISEEWKQNRRDKVQSEKLRRETQQALEKAIEDLKRRQAALKTPLPESASSAEREIHEQELDRLSALLSRRNAQLIEVTLPSTAPEETASADEANDLKKLFSDARSDIAGDFNKTLQLYHAAAGEREKIAALNENLAARKLWLKEHNAADKKPE